jgi:hypothetical protein
MNRLDAAFVQAATHRKEVGRTCEVIRKQMAVQRLSLASEYLELLECTTNLESRQRYYAKAVSLFESAIEYASAQTGRCELNDDAVANVWQRLTAFRN